MRVYTGASSFCIMRCNYSCKFLDTIFSYKFIKCHMLTQSCITYLSATFLYRWNAVFHEVGHWVPFPKNQLKKYKSTCGIFAAEMLGFNLEMHSPEYEKHITASYCNEDMTEQAYLHRDACL